MEVRVLGNEDGGGPGTSHRSRYPGHIDVDQDIWDIDVDLELIAFFAILTFLTKKLASTPSGVASVGGHLLFLD